MLFRSALNWEFPYPESCLARSLRSRSEPVFVCFQQDGFVEVQDHYLSLCLLVPNVVAENPWLDLHQWYARQANRILGEVFEFEDLIGDELVNLFVEPDVPAAPNTDVMRNDFALLRELPPRAREGGVSVRNGDLYWMRATSILQAHRPYFLDQDLEDELDFLIEPDGDDTYLVWTTMGFDDVIMITFGIARGA